MKITSAIISNAPPGERLLKSLGFAQEILVVRDGKEAKSSQKGKLKTYFHPLDNNFSAQRNFALSKAKGDWVFFVDNDEIVSQELSREIISRIGQEKHSAYYIPRKDICYHQVIKHGEAGHIKIIRLAKRKTGKFIRPVHETWKIKGRVGEISSSLYHAKDHFVSEFMDRMARYSQLDAPILTRENKPYSPFRLFINPLSKFTLNYFFKLGFLDGYPGLFLSYLMSVQSLTVRVFQWTNKNSSR